MAMEFVSRIDADLGGTEIYAPLKEILKRKTAFKNREIILLTDGQVSNEEAVIEMASKHKKKNRIFSFGIGNGVSQFLVKGLSKATNGQSEMISENERIEAKVLRTFSRLNSPRVDKVSFDWYGADIELADKNPGPIFEGDFLTLYGRTPGVVPEEVKMTVTFSDESTEEFSLNVTGIEAGNMAPLWAFKRLRALESVTLNKLNKKKITKQLVGVSKKYSVMCKETSFIAIEERIAEERNDGMPQLRRIPVALTKDWGGISIPCAAAPCAAPAPAGGSTANRSRSKSMKLKASASRNLSIQTGISLDMDAGFSRGRNASARPGEKSESKGGFFSRFFGGGGKDDDGQIDSFEDFECDDFIAEEVIQPSNDSDLFELLARQNANGLFTGQCSEKTKQMLGEMYAERTARTFEVLFILNTRFLNDKDIWTRSAKKATKALAQELEMSLDEIQKVIEEKSKQY